MKVFKLDENSQTENELQDIEKGELKNTQKALENILGIDFLTFARSIILGQNIVNNFISGPAEQRRAIIEETLGLEKFNLYFDEIKSHRSHIENQLEKTQLIKDQYNQQLNRIKADLEYLKASNSESLLLQKEEEKKLLLEGHENRVISLKNDKIQQEETLKNLQSLPKDAIYSENQLKQLLSFLRPSISEIHNWQKLITSLVDKQVCSQCGQHIQDPTKIFEHLLISISSWKLQFTSKNLDKDLLLADLCNTSIFTITKEDNPSPNMLQEELSKFMVLFKHTLENIEKKLESLHTQQRSLDSLNMKIMQLDRNLLQMENDKQRKLSEIEKTIIQINTATQHKQDQETTLEKNIHEIQEKITQLEEEIPTLLQDFQIAKFWEMAFDKKSKSQAGFTSLRAYILANAVKELNFMISKYLDTLSQAPLTVTLTADLELKEDYGKRYLYLQDNHY